MTRYPMPDYSVDELNRQYDNTSSAEAVKALKELRALSARCRSAIPLRPGQYGPGELETFDAFVPDVKNAPGIVFVHGGQWRLNTTIETSFWAEAAATRGFALFVINYPKVPQVRIRDQADCVNAAYAFITREAEAIGVDPQRLFLAGHSSGAHLAALAMARPIATAARMPKGLLLLSGMYDLEPVRLSSRNATLQLSPAEAREASPVWRLPKDFPPTLIAAGSGETQEFIRQSQLLHEAMDPRGGHRFALLKDDTHFTTPLDLYRSDSNAWKFIDTIC